MFPPDQPWHPELNWSAPAGQALQTLLHALREAQPHGAPASDTALVRLIITVVGSAPLQLALDAGFLSADVDIICRTDLRPIIERAGLGPGHARTYVQQSEEIVFSAGPTWRERAFSLDIEEVTLIFPHPLDILISKLPRLEPKDLDAFRLVIARTGHPTPAELTAALRHHVDLFRPGFDEEHAASPLVNTQMVWQEIYGLDIDVRAEIIVPALERRRRDYGTPPDHNAALAALARER